jgi:hypothetical protein
MIASYFDQYNFDFLKNKASSKEAGEKQDHRFFDRAAGTTDILNLAPSDSSSLNIRALDDLFKFKGSNLKPLSFTQESENIFSSVNPAHQLGITLNKIVNFTFPSFIQQPLIDFINPFIPNSDPSASDRSGFNIDLVSLGLTGSQQNILRASADFWETVITGDLPDIALGPFRVIDDLLIAVEASNIDGEGGILGQAGPSEDLLRSGSLLPSFGGIEFDSSDLSRIEDEGQLDDLFLHEIGHVLGIGTIWEDLGLLTGAGGEDPQFIGTNATAAYNEIFGLNVASVPVENTGREGTRDSHWRESVFANELMTGFLNSGVNNPLSIVTAASLVDLGYAVDLNAAESFTPPDTLVA